MLSKIISIFSSFFNHNIDKRFLCLGSWDHFDSNSQDKFLALMDMNEDPVDRPKYRCGVSRTFVLKFNNNKNAKIGYHQFIS